MFSDPIWMALRISLCPVGAIIWRTWICLLLQFFLSSWSHIGCLYERKSNRTIEGTVLCRENFLWHIRWLDLMLTPFEAIYKTKWKYFLFLWAQLCLWKVSFLNKFSISVQFNMANSWSYIEQRRWNMRRLFWRISAILLNDVCYCELHVNPILGFQKKHPIIWSIIFTLHLGLILLKVTIKSYNVQCCFNLHLGFMLLMVTISSLATPFFNYFAFCFTVESRLLVWRF
jgi:hypothetical protein